MHVRINGAKLLLFTCIISYLTKRLKEIKSLEYFSEYELTGNDLITEKQYEHIMDDTRHVP